MDNGSAFVPVTVVAHPHIRVAYVHGPGGFADRISAALAPAGFEVRPLATSEDLLARLADAEAALLVLDSSALTALAPGVLSSARGHVLHPVPLLVAACKGAEEVVTALARGARLGARADAGPEELRSLATACVETEEAERERDLVREDLARQRALAVKDDLTAAYNRRFFERHLDEELDRARRTGTSMGLIFMDIDNLKEVNRRYGHPTGSDVLREAAARTMRAVRSTDHVIRYGGDEFCIILPNSDANRALEVAERVRRSIADDAFVIEATGPVVLTASFGIAAFPEHALDRHALVRAADGAMCRSKEAQRNGIRVFENQLT